MQAVNITLPTRNKKGRFSNCIVGQQYHFEPVKDFPTGKQDAIRSSAAAYAKNKKMKAETHWFEKDTTLSLPDGTSQEVKAGLYITFRAIEQPVNKDGTATIPANS